MIVEAAGQRFKSKTALLTKIRELLHSQSLGANIGPEDSAFLNACLEQANRYYGYPVESPCSWRVQVHPVFKHREFVFHRPDGTRENPSIKRLSMMKPRGPKRAKDAARHDIKDQVLFYRNSRRIRGVFTCEDPECGHTSKDVAHFEVDHVTPFAELWLCFLTQIGAIEDELQVVEQLDDTGAMLTFGLEYPLNEAFAAFHRQNAKLQLLCLACHTLKTRADAGE